MQLRSLLARFFIVLFLVLQIGLPLKVWVKHGGFVVTNAKGEFPFSWRMYSSTRGRLKFVGIYANDRRKRLNPVKQVGAFLGNVGYGDYVPRLLCEKNPKIVSIQRKFKRKSETFEC